MLHMHRRPHSQLLAQVLVHRKLRLCYTRLWLKACQPYEPRALPAGKAVPSSNLKPIQTWHPPVSNLLGQGSSRMTLPRREKATGNLASAFRHLESSVCCPRPSMGKSGKACKMCQPHSQAHFEGQETTGGRASSSDNCGQSPYQASAFRWRHCFLVDPTAPAAPAAATAPKLTNAEL